MVFYFYIKNLFSYFMSNGIMNSVNILYTPNIEDVKNYQYYASPNTFIISSYYNNGSYIGFNYYNGLSYELYYIDSDHNINQLSYNIVPGNGLNIENNRFEINVDEKTLINNTKYNGKNYITVNMDSFKQASAINSGLLLVKNMLYYNDNYLDTHIDNDAFVVNDSTIGISNGLIHQLNNINLYYNRCVNLLNKIKSLYAICIKDLNIGKFIAVGTILYYDQSKKRYTLDAKTKSNINNTPMMVCVIASNILPDGYPRFIPLKRTKKSYVYDKSNILYAKNIWNQIPVYTTNDVDQIKANTSIVGSTYGFIAVKRNSWSNNVQNPFNDDENYFAETNKSTIYTYLDQYKGITLSQGEITNINWYVDSSKINYNDNYSIGQYGIYTQILHNVSEKLKKTTIYFIITLTFNNKTVKHYICNLKYQNNRFTNINKLYAYNLKKTITNNFSEISDNCHENYIKVSKTDNKLLINYKTIKTINIDDFIETSKSTNNTFIITNKKIELTNTKVDISIVSHNENKVTFNISASTNGKAILTTNYGILSVSSIILNNNTEKITLTNNSIKDITATINVLFIPLDTNTYQSSNNSITVSVNGLTLLKGITPPKINTINGIGTLLTDINSNTNTTTTNTNSNLITKTPSTISVVSNNKVYEYSFNGGD